MIQPVILQQEGLSEVQNAVRDNLQEGGSKVSVLVILALLGTLLILTHWLTNRTQGEDAAVRSNPRRLFRDLLSGLKLSKPQRRFLESVARQSQLEHAAILLLSSSEFDRHVVRGQEASSADLRREDVQDLRELLFPGSVVEVLD